MLLVIKQAKIYKKIIKQNKTNGKKKKGLKQALKRLENSFKYTPHQIQSVPVVYCIDLDKQMQIRPHHCLH